MYRGGALGRVESDLWKEACSDRGRPCTCHHVVLLASAFKIAIPYIEPDVVAGYEIGYCLLHHISSSPLQGNEKENLSLCITIDRCKHDAFNR